MGRPPLPRKDVRAERVVTFLTSEQRQVLQDFAQGSGQSISTAAQELIQQGLDQLNKNDQTNMEGSP